MTIEHVIPSDRQHTRRDVVSAGAALAALLGAAAVAARAGAQDATPDVPPAGDPIGDAITAVASTARLEALGFPTFDVTVGESGVVAPAQVEEGWHLVNLTGEAPYIAYLNFVQFPADLDIETATAQALDAGSNDIVRPGWHFAGGNNSFVPGEPTTFAIYLPAGDYHVAASYYLPEQGSEEIMTLVPFTVAGGATTPEATPVAAPEADIRLEMTDDLRYIVSPDPVPTGDLLWEVVNTGHHHPHHVVMSRYPDGTTAEDILADFEALFSGTPPAGEPLIAQAIPVAYAALQSGGTSTLLELNLTEPGDGYAIVCFIMDEASMRPHFLDGMITVFSVE